MVHFSTLAIAALVLGASAGATIVNPVLPRALAADESVELIGAVSYSKPKPKPVTLVPVADFREGNTKRDLRAALALQSKEKFVWGNPAGTFALVEVQKEGQDENIVNMEKFADMVTKMECPSISNGQLGLVKITFLTHDTLMDAADLWKWVNENSANKFTLAVGAGQCGSNADRLVFSVTTLQLYEYKNMAALIVRGTNWEDEMKSFDMTIGEAAASDAHVQRLVRRKFGSWWDDVVDWVGGAADDAADWIEGAVDTVGDWIDGIGNGPAGEWIDNASNTAVEWVGDAVDNIINLDLNKELAIPFHNNLTATGLKFKGFDVEIEAECKSCTTQGRFPVTFRFQARLGVPLQAFLEFRAEDVEVNADMSMSVKAITPKLYEYKKTISKIPIGGVTIPGLVSLGPNLELALAFEVAELKAGVSIGFGGTMKLEDSYARVDFLKQSDTKAEGWSTTFEPKPVTGKAFVEGKMSLYLGVSLGCEVSIFETGLSGKLFAKIPSLEAELDAIQSLNCQTCGNYEKGIQGAVNVRTDIGFKAETKVGGKAKTLWELSVYNYLISGIKSFCWGFGLQGDQCLAQYPETLDP